MDHAILINILRRRIHDEYFIALLWKFLKAGYVEDWTFYNTYFGTPQGSIVSPIMSGICLNDLDRYMENYIRECWEQKLNYLRYEAYAKDQWADLTTEERKTANDRINVIRNEMLKHEYSEPQDSGYRRLFYVRSARKMAEKAHRL